MIKKIDEILGDLNSCFSRKVTFYWFSIIIIGFIVRIDHLGVTSFVRWLFLRPESYELMLNFFRSTAWDLDVLLKHWAKCVMNRTSPITFNGRAVLIGDGIKVSKEARKMPGVKTLHQNSDNSGKAEHIQGHHFGFVGLLIGSLVKAFCIPLRGELHEGVNEFRPGEPFDGKPATLVTRMAHLIVCVAKGMGTLCYVTLDAFFATGPAFRIFQALKNEEGKQWVHLITRAKDNYVAYFVNDSQKRFHKTEKVKLTDVFNYPDVFETITLMIYGELRTVEYYCNDLLWKPFNGLIRFVFIKDGKGLYILMCSDLDLSPEDIITIYSYRFKIELMFSILKNLIGGFCYRFWSKLQPKFKRGKTIDYENLDEKEKNKIDVVVGKIERFVNLAGLAVGILQMLSITYEKEIWKNFRGWLRTYSSETPSERVVQSVIQDELFSSVREGKVPAGGTLRAILNRSRKPPPAPFG